MPRTARILKAGYPYHIVHRGNNKQGIFFDDGDRRKYLYLLKKYTGECGCSVFAYCLMSNHVHMLVVPDSEVSLPKTMQKLSLTYAQFINDKYARSGRLWESRYYSALIDKENYLLTVVRYIEQNPVRAKIVGKAVDYEWSSAQAIICGRKSFLASICDKYGIDRREYLKLIDEDLEESSVYAIGAFTKSGRSIASDEFYQKLKMVIDLGLRLGARGRPRKE